MNFAQRLYAHIIGDSTKAVEKALEHEGSRVVKVNEAVEANDQSLDLLHQVSERAIRRIRRALADQADTNDAQ